VYYIPGLLEDAKRFRGKQMEIDLKIPDKVKANKIAQLFEAAGSKTELTDQGLHLSGSLARIVAASLGDADSLFHNRSEEITTRYGYNEREVLYNWWLGLKALEKELTRQKHFQDAKFVAKVLAKAVECSYNYYQIEPLDISDKVIMVILSLIFYVVYTIWLGYGILYLLAGLGFQLEG
jgi:hypothetical protein